MWRLASLFLVGIAFAADLVRAQVPPPDIQTAAPPHEPDKTSAPPAGASPPAAPPPAASPSVTIPLPSPPAPIPAQPAQSAEPQPTPTVSGPVKPPADAKTETAPQVSGSTPESASVAPAKPKPPKVKSKPKLAPANPPGDERDDPSLAKDEAGSGKPPSFRCFVRDVMAFYDRTHVRCYNKARGKFIFFAVDTGQPIASTLFAKALNAIQLGKPVTIAYAPGSDLNPSNCDPANCRRLLDIKN